MGRTIACANQKGGVGKTTTVVNLAGYLSLAGERVLLIDLDPQGNATSGLGLDRTEFEYSIYDALVDEMTLASIVVQGPLDLDVVPSSVALAGAEVELVGRPNRDQAMRTALDAIRDQYDYVLIDCPPSLGLITINMLAAADALLIPLQH